MCVFQKALLEEPQKRNSRPVCFRRIQRCCSFLKREPQEPLCCSLLLSEQEEPFFKNRSVVQKSRRSFSKEDIGGVLCFRKEEPQKRRHWWCSVFQKRTALLFKKLLTHSLTRRTPKEEPQKKNPKRRTALLETQQLCFRRTLFLRP